MRNLAILVAIIACTLVAPPAHAGGSDKSWNCNPPFIIPCLIPDWPAYDSSWSEVPIILPGIFSLKGKDVEARWMVKTTFWHTDGSVSVCRSTGYRDRGYNPPRFRRETIDCGAE